MTIIDTLLSKGERKVYDYIKDKTNGGEKTLKESYKSIGLAVDVSEATVHRAVNKLLSNGIITISSDKDKSESNEIHFFGEFESADSLIGEPFFEVINELHLRSKRFKTIIESYQLRYEAIERENRELKEKLKALSNNKTQPNNLFDDEAICYKGYSIKSSDILEMTDINDDLVAFIVKRQK